MLAIAAAGLELSADDRLLAGSSLSHVGAFYVSFAALSVGACVVVARSFDGDELLPLLREGRPTVLSMLPSALFALTRDHGAHGEDFASLRLCRAAGDCVSAELEREFTGLTGLVDRRGIRAHRGRARGGQPALPGDPGRLGGQAGARRHGGDPQRRTAARWTPAGEGRLWIRTPSATVGYWDNDEATAELFHDGWLDTGDVMRADEDGYLYFCGRRKQIIVHDGSNITPQVVEGALLEHPSVGSAGVVGIHDLVHGENVRAYVTLARWRRAPGGAGADPLRAGAGRLQGAGGDRVPRADAAHRQRQGRPVSAQAHGRAPAAGRRRLTPSKQRGADRTTAVCWRRRRGSGL